MGRPAGSKNAAKKAAGKKAAGKKAAAGAATPPREAKPMSPAQQSNGPTEIEIRQYLERYRNHRRALADIMKEAGEERGNGRSILKSFESKGGNPDMLRKMFDLTDMTKAEADAFIAEYMGYAIKVGIEPPRVIFDAQGQGSLADVLETPIKPTVEAEEALDRTRAYNDGWNSAKEGGLVTQNPKIAGTADHQNWAKGFGDWHWEKEHGGKPTNGTAAQPNADIPADPTALAASLHSKVSDATTG